MEEQQREGGGEKGRTGLVRWHFSTGGVQGTLERQNAEAGAGL